MLKPISADIIQVDRLLLHVVAVLVPNQASCACCTVVHGAKIEPLAWRGASHEPNSVLYWEVQVMPAGCATAVISNIKYYTNRPKAFLWIFFFKEFPSQPKFEFSAAYQLSLRLVLGRHGLFWQCSRRQWTKSGSQAPNNLAAGSKVSPQKMVLRLSLLSFTSSRIRSNATRFSLKIPVFLSRLALAQKERQNAERRCGAIIHKVKIIDRECKCIGNLNASKAVGFSIFNNMKRAPNQPGD